ncbi:cytosine deaminase [Lysinibacillus sp. 2017]|uniref:cytosine deaminase n=1 Tax=unclassified Lysinibacillus TaxID=2636778 RepID=UPI000D526C3D|nr:MULTISPECIES: cytosine deaminase [unclassified Lysinibacillus]AWE07575.1 cytosine deaminase [Lysinibacillus sp. 2017]TGN36739.1 cytosine deaminase [Lysinibacillus sp. S2017]
MEQNLLRIDELLNMPKSVIRKANEKDVLNIKNELLMLLNEKNEAYKQENIRQLINEIQFLNVYVVKDNQDKIIYSYDPPKYASKRVTIKESGWIEINKK